MTPAEHLHTCNPLTCQHVRFCDDCLKVYGVCREHRRNPDDGIFWVEGQEPKEKP